MRLEGKVAIVTGQISATRCNQDVFGRNQV